MPGESSDGKSHSELVFQSCDPQWSTLPRTSDLSYLVIVQYDSQWFFWMTAHLRSFLSQVNKFHVSMDGLIFTDVTQSWLGRTLLIDHWTKIALSRLKRFHWYNVLQEGVFLGRKGANWVILYILLVYEVIHRRSTHS